MDDDALRRGKPTNHRVYGEAMAILAGDGLLNMAYETMLAAPLTQNAPERALPAIREIAERAGVRGMVAGQVLDVTMEGQPPRKDIVRYIHLHKTADLLTAPLTAGLMLAGADEAQLELGRRYGRGLGLAFQIEDDLLDLEGDVKLLGKDVGMDAQRGKMTWPAVAGVEQAPVSYTHLDRQWWGICNFEWALYYREENRLPPFNCLLENERFFALDCGLSYPIVGAFTEYLLLTYGTERYLSLIHI